MSRLVSDYQQLIQDNTNEMKEDIARLKSKLHTVAANLRQSKSCNERIEEMIREVQWSQSQMKDRLLQNDERLDSFRALLTPVTF